MDVTIYHNPRCSKSRQTLALLQERGLEPEIVEYLKAPPTAAELRAVLKQLNMSPRELLRRKEASFKALNLADTSLSDSALIEAMREHPVLIERPIVIGPRGAAIGRPPEAVLEILA